MLLIDKIIFYYKFSIFGNILLMDQKDTQILLSELNCYRFGNKMDQIEQLIPSQKVTTQIFKTNSN